MVKSNIATEYNRQIVQMVSWVNVVEFDYTNSKGEQSHKKVEVYDADDRGFFGFDLEENKTKKFLFENMTNLAVGGGFEPRFLKK